MNGTLWEGYWMKGGGGLGRVGVGSRVYRRERNAYSLRQAVLFFFSREVCKLESMFENRSSPEGAYIKS